MMPSRECLRCGGSIRPYYPPGERQPQLHCQSCGHEPPPSPPPPPPPPPPRNAAMLAAIAARVTPRREEVAQLYRQGVWPLDISRRLDMPPSIVYDDLRLMGLSPGKRRISTETKQKIIAMRKAGITPAQINRELGVCIRTIHRHGERAGIPSRREQEQALKRDGLRLLRVLRPLGWSYQRIGDRLGVRKSTAHRWAVEAGLQQGDPPNRIRGTERA